jgi:hypothetical protein
MNWDTLKPYVYNLVVAIIATALGVVGGPHLPMPGAAPPKAAQSAGAPPAPSAASPAIACPAPTPAPAIDLAVALLRLQQQETERHCVRALEQCGNTSTELATWRLEVRRQNAADATARAARKRQAEVAKP